MTETREEWIKKRAYALWEEEGHPTGRDSIHWEQAKKEREKLEGSAASKDGKEVKTRANAPHPPGRKATALQSRLRSVPSAASLPERIRYLSFKMRTLRQLRPQLLSYG